LENPSVDGVSSGGAMREHGLNRSGSW